MQLKLLLSVLLLSVASLGAFAQNSLPGPTPAPATKAPAPSKGPLLTADLFSLSFTPGVAIPIFSDAALFDVGGTGDLAAELRMPFFPMMYVGTDVEYTFSPVRRNGSVSMLSGGLNVGVSYEIIPNLLELKGFGGFGYFYGFLNGGGAAGGSNPVGMAGLGVSYNVSPTFSVGVTGTYRYFFGLYNDIAIAIGTSYHFGGGFAGSAIQRQGGGTRPAPLGAKSGTGLQFSKIDISDVYPVFYKFYDDHPIGSAVIHNYERSSVQNVKVSVFVKEYMTDPKEIVGPDRIDPGKDAAVDLYGLFTKDILSNTESTKVSARVTLTYTLRGAPVTQDSVQTLQVLRRNSLTWDDDRKAAAFVSANDPTAVKFAKNVQSMVQGKASATLEPNLLLAMAMHDALTLYGLTYSTDPVATLNSDAKTVDYIQFPQQTLDYKGGKCSDFSVLYASMFEAIGVESAFITIPGHIFMAVALTMGPEEVRKTFPNSDDFIYQDNKAWLPIEITLRDGGFLKAWQLGAKEWRENKAKNQAAFYPLHDAWKTYQPVGYSSSTSNIAIPAQDKLVKVYTNEVSTFVAAQIGRQEGALLAAANRASNKSKPLNSLAVLYSRYGLYDKARRTLNDVLAKDEYVPALINMGNIYFVQSQVDKALEYYNRAYKKDPNNPTVLLCVARANHSLENYSIAKKAYADLEAKNPELAQRFAYLDLRGEEATRAADANGVRKVVIWQE
jgi:transglutaminase-like putative cysteine protease